jgi:aminopeptidase N
MAGALGVSWSGLIFLNGESLLSNPYYVDQEPGRLAFTVAHEIGHQWWGGMIGVNSNDHTFLLEGLTNYLAVAAIEQTAGDAAAAEQLRAQCAQPYLNALEQYGDGVADGPITVERDGPPLGSLTYGKAALGFLAIRQEIGDEAFFAALRMWAEEFKFGIAGPDDLLTAFENTSGAELAELWRFWFLAAETTPADVHALFA